MTSSWRRFYSFDASVCRLNAQSHGACVRHPKRLSMVRWSHGSHSNRNSPHFATCMQRATMMCSSAVTTASLLILSVIALTLHNLPHCNAFPFPHSRLSHRTTVMSASSSGGAGSTGEWLYGIPNSSWTSPEWNWGYASGTGHDCAAMCRRKFASRDARADFVASLLDPTSSSTSCSPEQSSLAFEEVKLVLGLAIQRGRWDGSDGGPGGYGDVLAAMADARRYETDGTEESRMVNFVNDMKVRYRLLNPSEEDMEAMESVDVGIEANAAIRKCSGLVLQSMGFIENGL